MNDTARHAAELIDKGDLDALRDFVDEHPDVITAPYANENPPSDEYHLLCHLLSWPGGRPGAAATARLLLDRGADPNTRYNDTETVLHWAASYPDTADLVDVLVAAGADVDVGGGVIRGGTPLMNAVHFGFTDVAARLARHGASVHNMITAAGLARVDLLNAWYLGNGRYRSDAARVTPTQTRPDDDIDGAVRDSWTFGAVIAASRCLQFGVVDWFIERGFDIDHIPENEEWGCLHHAAYCGSLPMAMFLVARGADLEVATSYGARPAGFAHAHGHAEVMNYLVDRGAETTLTEAAHFGRIDQIADIDVRDQDAATLLAAMVGTTTVIGKPVAAAVIEGRLAGARFILQRDPTLARANVDGSSLIELATKAGDDAMIAVLRDADARA